MGNGNWIPGRAGFDDHYPRFIATSFNPSSDEGMSDKLGIDATVPLGADPFRYERIRIPGEKDIDLESYLELNLWQAAAKQKR